MTNSHSNPDTAGWKKCRGDEIGGCVRKLKAARSAQVTRRRMMLTSSMTAAVALLLAVGWGLRDRPLKGNIGCKKVIASTDAYFHHALDDQTAARIRKHLELCPYCLDHYEAVGDPFAEQLTGFWKRTFVPVLASTR
ncbi:zf-HC2 domain-containing protein [Rubinisphaera margarita]|uniref:zf-HC2 domain-containing protein n=1 Tax=Rubinisphaera margarita TaxID=2909586 RepID=UPI001EE90936|nr:zf-HC2 domain-containing protein [Rubinisphaera margarita]MCG6157470.1 zf-HC2 domain-containing protein [Rubinisphaera margarita]